MALSHSQTICLVLLTLGCMVCLAGLCTPYWEYKVIQAEGGPDDEIEVGLFYACARVQEISFDQCDPLPWNLGKYIDDDTYFKAVRVLMSASTFTLLVSCVTGLVECLRHKHEMSIMLQAVLSTLGGVAGVAGIATFAAVSDGKFNPFGDELDVNATDLTLQKGWSFYLSAAGSGFVLLAGLLSMCVPRRAQGRYELNPTTECAKYGGLSNPAYVSMDASKPGKS